MGLRAHEDPAAAVGVRTEDRVHPLGRARLDVLLLLEAVDDPAAREVGAPDDLAEVVVGEVRVVDERLHRGGDLAEVVRRDVARHSHGDAGRAVHQEVRHPCRQHRRLEVAVVVVRVPVDGLLLDVGEELRRDRRGARLRVVADEAVRDEAVIVGIDAKRIHGLKARILDRRHRRVVVRPIDQGLDHSTDLVVRQVGEDLLAVPLPALDPVDVVLPQPFAVGPPRHALAADVIRDEWNGVGAHRAAGEWDLRELRLQLCLLRAVETNIGGE